ncbi:type I polyketide synthase [Mycobacterium sp. SMC-4]|uniref:type I polyketide synthase n=1 Tax=Mycobacterium sp. SMC-4 TaxID=2857059 RepID=UPI0021B297A0|nr:type I polyketide synthase [Mycobacterium sp. SMC-4]UXA16397.1 type I polyketide synthase [Mycobacterium sp. SMC-4]
MIAKDEPIAVIGMACRFPGAETVGQFRDLLLHGVDAVGSVPSERWDADAYYSETPGVRGKTPVRHGGFCSDFAAFDNELFAISPEEAERMDPQHRVLLEVGHETLASAGLSMESMAGTATGVYVGISTFDYYERFSAQDRDGLLGTGLAHSAAAGRLAYHFDLNGAAESIDTACSSALVAVHRACGALASGEVDAALAGGVNAMFSPTVHITFSQAGMLAPDGRCKTFDDRADGYGRGEGCGLVMLKRIADAQRDGDPVLALISGSAVNHNGRSHGMAAPNGPAQQAVIRRALQAAGMQADDLGCVEAHGTGTLLGDAIEFNALSSVIGSRPPGHRVAVGSVKTNIGHLEASAGIAGLIKAVLEVQMNEVFPQLHFHRASRHLGFDSNPLAIADVRRPLPPSRAGIAVSSFGFSGTNAHVIITPAPATDAETPSRTGPLMLAFSARKTDELRDTAGRLARYLRATPSADLAAVASHLRRLDARGAQRFACVVTTAAEAISALRRFSTGAAVEAGGWNGSSAKRPRIALLFTGEGSHHTGMATGLYQSDSLFRTAFDEVANVMDTELDRPLPTLLSETPPGADLWLAQPRYRQPAIFAVGYALAQSFGAAQLNPSVVLGCGVGELVASVVAGVIALRDAARLVCRRGALMHRAAADTAMVSVAASEEDLGHLAAAHGLADVDVAVVYGPHSVVVSVPRSDLAKLSSVLSDRNIRYGEVAVSPPPQSPPADDIAAFTEYASGLTFRAPRIPLVSNVSGARLQQMSASYVRGHLRRTVEFHLCLETVKAMDIDAVVELGPAPHLADVARSTLGPDIPIITTLRPDLDDDVAVLRAAAQLYSLGVEIDREPHVSGASQAPRVSGSELPRCTVFDRKVFLSSTSAVAPVQPVGVAAGSGDGNCLGGGSSS